MCQMVRKSILEGDCGDVSDKECPEGAFSEDAGKSSVTWSIIFDVRRGFLRLSPGGCHGFLGLSPR